MSYISNFGRGDATYLALGKEAGIRALVHSFYDHMETNDDYANLWSWHTGERELMRDKLALFLCMWSGGPRKYQEKYGVISIPDFHAHLPVTQEAVDQWLNCMREALQDRQYPEDLSLYLMHHFAIPAERIRKRCHS